MGLEDNPVSGWTLLTFSRQIAFNNHVVCSCFSTSRQAILTPSFWQTMTPILATFTAILVMFGYFPPCGKSCVPF